MSSLIGNKERKDILKQYKRQWDWSSYQEIIK